MTTALTADRLWTGRITMTNNVFKDHMVRDVFLLDVLEKIAYDWKESDQETYTRDNFEEFVDFDLQVWFLNVIDDFLDEEFGEEDDE